MRTELIEYMQGLNIGGFTVSQELPWEESGTALHIKNLKKIYVDTEQYTTEPLYNTLNGHSVYSDIIVVRAFFANDAKQLPPNYSDAIAELRQGRNIEAAQGFNRRECLVSTSVEADRLITELEYRFTKITT